MAEGMGYRKRGMLKQAIAANHKALEIQKYAPVGEPCIAMLNLAVLYNESEKWETAIHWSTQALMHSNLHADTPFHTAQASNADTGGACNVITSHKEARATAHYNLFLAYRNHRAPGCLSNYWGSAADHFELGQKEARGLGNQFEQLFENAPSRSKVEKTRGLPARGRSPAKSSKRGSWVEPEDSASSSDAMYIFIFSFKFTITSTISISHLRISRGKQILNRIHFYFF